MLTKLLVIIIIYQAQVCFFSENFEKPYFLFIAEHVKGKFTIFIYK